MFVIRKSQPLIFLLYFILIATSPIAEKEDWSNAGYFKINNVSGREIFIDPLGKPFYAVSMVYAYGPDAEPRKGKMTVEKLIDELTEIKRHGREDNLCPPR